jgi:hypothetical protein
MEKDVVLGSSCPYIVALSNAAWIASVADLVAALMALLREGLDGAGKTGPSRGHGWTDWAREVNDRDERVRRVRTNAGEYMMYQCRPG